MGKWDLGLDYQKTYRELTSRLEEARKKKGIRALRQRLYLMILLTQLRNGSRVGEAIEFLGMVYETRKKRGEIRVEKRKDGETRLMILPKEITRDDILSTKALYEEIMSKGKRHFVSIVSTYARRNLGINTHSLRYAFVGYLGKQGYPAQIIAKITKHKRLDYILNYTQEKIANTILEKLG